jgi:hypothetical protein
MRDEIRAPPYQALHGDPFRVQLAETIKSVAPGGLVDRKSRSPPAFSVPEKSLLQPRLDKVGGQTILVSTSVPSLDSTSDADASFVTRGKRGR